MMPYDCLQDAKEHCFTTHVSSGSLLSYYIENHYTTSIHRILLIKRTLQEYNISSRVVGEEWG